MVNQIERYLKSLLEDSDKGVIELQRNELAGIFKCVPSQINYVLSTRFSLQQGYAVESRRGGGGYVRIVKLPLPSIEWLYNFVLENLENEVAQNVAEGLIQRLHEEGMLTSRETQLLYKMLHRDTLQLELPERDRLRARLLRAVLLEISKVDTSETRRQ